MCMHSDIMFMYSVWRMREKNCVCLWLALGCVVLLYPYQSNPMQRRHYSWRPGSDMANGFIFGSLEPFRPDTEGGFTAYMERVRLFLEANEVSEAKQVPVFLSCVGSATYGLVRNLLAPAQPKDKSLEEIVDTLKAHYEPKPLVIAERFHFHGRNQGTNESIADYVAELRRLASRCQFEAYLEEALRDRFVCGVLSEATQRRLLSQEKLTFATAVQEALTREKAEKNAKELKEREEINVRVGKIGRKQKQVPRTPNDSVAQSKSCYRCGRAGHTAGECRAQGECVS